MKNKKQLFSLLLLASCSLMQQTVFASAASAGEGSANPPGGPSIHNWQFYAETIVPGFKLKGLENQHTVASEFVYNSKIEELEFSKLITALETVAKHNQKKLYSALLESVEESIYDETTLHNAQLLTQKNGRELLTSIQKEFKRLENSGEISLKNDNDALGFSEEEKTNILQPIYTWAKEQRKKDLVDELSKILL
jgi:hypothetical protein